MINYGGNKSGRSGPPRLHHQLQSAPRELHSLPLSYTTLILFKSFIVLILAVDTGQLQSILQNFMTTYIYKISSNLPPGSYTPFHSAKQPSSSSKSQTPSIVQILAAEYRALLPKLISVSLPSIYYKLQSDQFHQKAKAHRLREMELAKKIDKIMLQNQFEFQLGKQNQYNWGN